MRLTTKLTVLLAVVAVSLFAINSGNTARAQTPAGTDTVIVDVTTYFVSGPTQSGLVVLTGTMTVEREAETESGIECEIVAMQLNGTSSGIPISVLAGSQNGITPSFCTITEQEIPESGTVDDIKGFMFFEVDVGNDGSVDLLNCNNEPIPFGATVSEVPITSPVSFGPLAAGTGVGVALCDPQGTTPIGSFGVGGFDGGAAPVPLAGPPAVGGIAGLTAEDGSLRGSESSSSANAMTLILLGVGFVSIVALATGGWYFRRRLIP
jgi:hypothetical protein